MTNQLFWIIHFVKYVSTCTNGISPFNQHLLILDGHGSHDTLKIVQQAKKCGFGFAHLMKPYFT